MVTLVFQFFILVVVLMIIGLILSWWIKHRMNQVKVQTFLEQNNCKLIGKHSFGVKKNFLSPKNINYSFTSATLYHSDKGILFIPEMTLFTLCIAHLPFIISNKAGVKDNMNIFEYELISDRSSNSTIRVFAPYNTILTIITNDNGELYEIFDSTTSPG